MAQVRDIKIPANETELKAALKADGIDPSFSGRIDSNTYKAWKREYDARAAAVNSAKVGQKWIDAREAWQKVQDRTLKVTLNDGASANYSDIQQKLPSQRQLPYRRSIDIRPDSSMSSLVAQMQKKLPLNFGGMERFKGDQTIWGVLHETSERQADPDKAYNSVMRGNNRYNTAKPADYSYNILATPPGEGQDRPEVTVMRPVERTPGSNGAKPDERSDFNGGSIAIAMNGTHAVKGDNINSARNLFFMTAMYNHMRTQAEKAGKTFRMTGHDSVLHESRDLKCCPGCRYANWFGLKPDGTRDPQKEQLGDPAVLAQKTRDREKMSASAWSALSDEQKFKKMDGYLEDVASPQALASRYYNKLSPGQRNDLMARVEKMTLDEDPKKDADRRKSVISELGKTNAIGDASAFRKLTPFTQGVLIKEALHNTPGEATISVASTGAANLQDLDRKLRAGEAAPALVSSKPAGSGPAVDGKPALQPPAKPVTPVSVDKKPVSPLPAGDAPAGAAPPASTFVVNKPPAAAAEGKGTAVPARPAASASFDEITAFLNKKGDPKQPGNLAHFIARLNGHEKWTDQKITLDPKTKHMNALDSKEAWMAAPPKIREEVTRAYQGVKETLPPEAPKAPVRKAVPVV
jgi:hypothetical protein